MDKRGLAVWMERVDLLQIRRAENRDQNLAVFADSKVFDPSFVGKSVNIADGEGRARVYLRESEPVHAHRSEKRKAYGEESVHRGKISNL